MHMRIGPINYAVLWFNFVPEVLNVFLAAGQINQLRGWFFPAWFDHRGKVFFTYSIKKFSSVSFTQLWQPVPSLWECWLDSCYWRRESLITEGIGAHLFLMICICTDSGEGGWGWGVLTIMVFTSCSIWKGNKICHLGPVKRPFH